MAKKQPQDKKNSIVNGLNQLKNRLKILVENLVSFLMFFIELNNTILENSFFQNTFSVLATVSLSNARL